jgi:hypothetical protein
VLFPRVESAKKSAPKSADIQMTGRNGYIPLKKRNFLRTFMPKAQFRRPKSTRTPPSSHD